MPKLVIENLKVSELPRQWAERLKANPDQRVTVRIETQAGEKTVEIIGAFSTSDPAFGIWRDRDDVVDVEDYAKRLRAPRYTRS